VVVSEMLESSGPGVIGCVEESESRLGESGEEG